MARIRKGSHEYGHLSNDDYYRITKFDKSENRIPSYDSIKSEEQSRGIVQFEKMEISKSLFCRILNYLSKEGVITRDHAPQDFKEGTIPYSFTVYTLYFALHAVKGKRGGWFIISNQGREPIIKDEFISYGRMRRSGTRTSSYRRNLSQTEKAQVEWLSVRTPNFEKLYEWISKKYPSDIKKVSLYYEGDYEGGIPF